MQPSYLLVAIAVALLIAAVPRWPYNASWEAKAWGYYPVGGLGVALLILLILIWMGLI